MTLNDKKQKIVDQPAELGISYVSVSVSSMLKEVEDMMDCLPKERRQSIQLNILKSGLVSTLAEYGIGFGFYPEFDISDIHPQGLVS